MNFVFGLEAAGLAAAITAVVASFLLVAFITLYTMHRVLRTHPMAVPVAPYFVAVTTVWALLLSFVAADSWSANDDANRILNEERSAIQRLEGLARIDSLGLEHLGEVVATYRAAVVDAEWGDGRNRAHEPAAEAAIEEIRRALVEASLAGLPAALAAKAIADFEALQDARSHRLAMGKAPADSAKWYLLLALTGLAHIAIALVHADRPPAAWPALILFALACWASLFVLALYAQPYDGTVRIEPGGLLSAP